MKTKFPTNELSRCYHLILTLDKLTNTIEKEFQDDPRWFLFSLKISKKLLFHCKNFCLNSADKLFDENIKTEKENIFVDVPGLFSNLRLQIDCYSTLHHIFFDNVDWEIKRLRFDLWRYDSFIEKIKLKIDGKDDHKQIETIKLNIENNSFYKLLDSNKQKLVFDSEKYFANWKFFPTKLSKKESKTKWNDLFLNSGIKIDEINILYGFLSMYVHSNFFSVSHLTEMNRSESNNARLFAIMFSSFIVCFTIDDLISKFIPGKKFLKEMKERDFEIIKSFLTMGRTAEKNKNFF